MNEATVTNENATMKAKPPKSAFENDYVTMNHKEETYLWRHGIKAIYVDRSSPYGLRKWKYKKTAELFRAVADFYEQENNRLEFEKLVKMIPDAATDAFIPLRFFGIGADVNG